MEIVVRAQVLYGDHHPWHALLRAPYSECWFLQLHRSRALALCATLVACSLARDHREPNSLRAVLTPSCERPHSIAMATIHARPQVRVYVGLTEAQSEDMLNGRNVVSSYMNRWGLRPTAIAAPRRC